MSPLTHDKLLQPPLSQRWFANCGGLDNFLAEYWQRKPLLIRQALPGFTSPLDANELAGLALEEDIESRLIIENNAPPYWTLKFGPFNNETFASLPSSHWTLLVQAVNQWVPEVNDLLANFDFLPQWRLDDIMLSYAADQGSVGPHFDQYDVFLLQGLGQRRWRLGQFCDAQTPLLKGPSLRILADFEQRHEWLLKPGDMLYLPPGLAHWGVAEGECMTYSIGFRAPSAAEMLGDMATELLTPSTTIPELIYRDPKLTSMMAKGPIDPHFIDAVRDLLLRQLDDKEQLSRWFSRFMTTRKYPELELNDGYVDAHPIQLTPCNNTPLTRHPSSRFAVLAGDPATLAVDGELYHCSQAFATQLTDSQNLTLTALGKLDGRDQDVLDILLKKQSLLIDN